MNDAIQRIKKKIQDHGVIINDVISMKEIRNFEKDSDIILPDELVSFYTEIGNGCQMIDGFYLKQFDELDFNISKVKEDFIFKKYWIWEEDDNDDLLKKG